jgi:hypothetical protein
VPRRARKVDRIPREGRRPKLRPALANRGMPAAKRPESSPEAPGCGSSPSDYGGLGQGRDAHSAAPGSGLPAKPPGVVVFQPQRKHPPERGPVTYPRYLRQLAPNEDRLVLPDPETGRYPRLPAESVAEPARTRRPVDWGSRPPSKTAFANWLRESSAELNAETLSFTEAAE